MTDLETTTMAAAPAADLLAGEERAFGAIHLDVTDIDAVRAFVSNAEPFDILVNNAGSNRPAPFVEVKVEDFDSAVACTPGR